MLCIVVTDKCDQMQGLVSEKMTPGLSPVDRANEVFEQSWVTHQGTGLRTNSKSGKRGLIWVEEEKKELIVEQTRNSAKESFGASEL